MENLKNCFKIWFKKKIQKKAFCIQIATHGYLKAYWIESICTDMEVV